MRMAVIKLAVAAAALFAAIAACAGRGLASWRAPADRSARFSNCSNACANPASGW